MKGRYLLAAVIVLGSSPVLLAMLAVCAIFLLVGLPIVLIGALFSLLETALRSIVNFLGVFQTYLAIRKRGRVLIPPPLVFLLLIASLWFLYPSVPHHSALFVHEYSDFLQLAAQLLAALFVGLVFELRSARSPEKNPVARPAKWLTVFLLVLGELASLAALLPILPADLDRAAVILTVSAGLSSIIAILLLTLRVYLGDDRDAV